MRKKATYQVEESSGAVMASGVAVFCAFDEVVAADSLIPNPRNPNRHSDEQIRLLAKIIKHQGWRAPITVSNLSGFIVRGHGRLMAAQKLGLEDVPIDRQDYATEAEEWADLIADNRLSELSEIDNPSLKDLLEELDTGLLEALGADMELTGFTEQAMADIMSQFHVGEVTEDEPPEPPKVAVSRLGDIWICGKHRVMCGDSTDAGSVALLMGGEKADCVLTDPPYGINREGIKNDDPEGLSALFAGILENIPADNAIIIAFQSPRLFTVWLDEIRAAGHKFERMLWMYKPADCTFPWRGWLLTSEAILISTIGEGNWKEIHPFMHDCYSPTTIGKELPAGIGTHASVKPLAVVHDLLQRTGGDKTYDPFLGSGTTMIAAEQLSRRCYGMELEPRYVDVSVLRWQKLTGQEATLESTGATFSQVAVERGVEVGHE